MLKTPKPESSNALRRRCPVRLSAVLPFLATIGLLFGSPGCSSLLTPGNVITAHAHGNAEEPDRAPSDGEYSLYSKYGDPTPYHTVGLKSGDPLGFRTANTGQIDVIAGDDEWTMTDGDYIWKRN